MRATNNEGDLPRELSTAPQVLESTLNWLDTIIGPNFPFLNQESQPENIASLNRWNKYVNAVYRVMRIEDKERQERLRSRVQLIFAAPLLSANHLNNRIGTYLHYPNEKGAEEFAETLDLSKLSDRANLMIREFHPWSRFTFGLRWNPQFDDWKNSQPETTRKRLETYGNHDFKKYYRSKKPITSVEELRSKLNEALDKPGTDLAFDVGNSPALAELEEFWINQIENECFKHSDSKLADGFTTNPILLTRPVPSLLKFVEFITKNPRSWRTWHFASTNLITELMQIETECSGTTFSQMILDAIKKDPKTSLAAKFVQNPNILESKPELRKKIIETLIGDDSPDLANLIIINIPTVKLLIDTVEPILNRIPDKQYPIYLLNGIYNFLYKHSAEGEIQDLVNYIVKFPNSSFAELLADILSKKKTICPSNARLLVLLYDAMLESDPEQKTKFSQIFYPRLQESGLKKQLLTAS